MQPTSSSTAGRRRFAPGAASTISTLVLLLTVVPLQAQTTILVPGDQPTIQAAIDFAVNGDTVLVAPGTYVENLNFNGKAITVRSSGGAAVTTIDGGAADSVVIFDSGEGRDSVLDGFTLTNGSGGSFGGGGVRIRFTSPTVLNNDIINNVSCSSGGGIRINSGSPLIQGNLVDGNSQSGCSGGSGGGIYVGGAASAEIVGNVISNNTWIFGGGISFFAAGTPVLRDNLIQGNTAGNSGGGMELVNVSDALIVQNLIIENSAPEGGGIAWLVPSSGRGPFLVNNTIAHNDSPQGSGVFADGFDIQAELVNNIIVANPGQTAVECGDFNDLNPPVFAFNNVYSPSGAAYGGICVDQTGSNGNISADPLFVNAALDDYHLQAGSPSIDAGDDTNPDLPALDFDGEPRIDDGDGDGVGQVDMGFDELFENDLPVVVITQPFVGVSFTDLDNVTFTALADDQEDGDIRNDLVWTSDLDGAIGSGGSFTTSSLSLGVHLITASVTDSHGGTTDETIQVTIHTAPTVTLLTPAAGSIFNEGDPIDFTGTASDAEDGDLTDFIAWGSSPGGTLGFGGAITVPGDLLPPGDYEIFASVLDSQGGSAEDSIMITINARPSVVINAPADGTVVDAGSSVSFSATASDPEDGDLTAGLTWTSDLDGPIGSGGSFATAGLSAGVHTLTAEASDSRGASGSAAITLTVNGLPSLTITAPADGSAFNQGASVTFVASASDPEDGDLTAAISWTSSLDGALGSGGSVVTAGLSAGTHVITASVSDSQGAAASDTVTVTINAMPSVTITSPVSGSVFNQGTSVGFSGTASDPEDGDLTATISWTSSLDGAIGSGASFATAGLSVGIHVITASVSDSQGEPASAAITVTINGLPSLAITAPASGSIFNQGVSVTFAATASDPEDGDLTASISWTSNLDGALGSGGSFATAGLSLGTHVITASVSDSQGAGASGSVTVTINAVPSVTITAPADGSVFGTGDPVTFTGSASDLEDGDLSAVLVWSSDLDGTIGSGASFSTTSLSAGTHVVTASVVDSAGATAAAAVSVTVKVPIVVTFTSISVDDGWVRESSENSGTGGTVRSSSPANQDRGIQAGDDRNDKQYRGFASFDTSSIPAGATLRSATLRLRRDSVTGTGPFATHGALTADVRSGAFGGSDLLESSDFEAAATAAGAATLSVPAADGDWSEGTFDAAGLAAVNVSGLTQLRVAFALDDDDDRRDDFVTFNSGDNSDPGTHPQLVIEYLD